MFKKLIFLMVPILMLMGNVGCSIQEDVTPAVSAPVAVNNMQYGCVIVADDYGEREVCDTQFYYLNGSLTYWDAYFGIWVGPGGYWLGGRWYAGFYPGFHAHYGQGWYHPRGWYAGRGYYGGYHNSYHGSFHGGGFHGGGFHGGHR